MADMLTQLQHDLNRFFHSTPRRTPDAEVPRYYVEFGEDGDVEPRFIVGPLTKDAAWALVKGYKAPTRGYFWCPVREHDIARFLCLVPRYTHVSEVPASLMLDQPSQ